MNYILLCDTMRTLTMDRAEEWLTWTTFEVVFLLLPLLIVLCFAVQDVYDMLRKKQDATLSPSDQTSNEEAWETDSDAESEASTETGGEEEEPCSPLPSYVQSWPGMLAYIGLMAVGAFFWKWMWFGAPPSEALRYTFMDASTRALVFMILRAYHKQIFRGLEAVGRVTSKSYNSVAACLKAVRGAILRCCRSLAAGLKAARIAYKSETIATTEEPTTRPNTMTWSKITEDVIEAGVSRYTWSRRWTGKSASEARRDAVDSMIIHLILDLTFPYWGPPVTRFVRRMSRAVYRGLAMIHRSLMAGICAGIAEWVEEMEGEVEAANDNGDHAASTDRKMIDAGTSTTGDDSAKDSSSILLTDGSANDGAGAGSSEPKGSETGKEAAQDDLAEDDANASSESSSIVMIDLDAGGDSGSVVMVSSSDERA
jgi:hypothetical protein